jgi:hypothetical protein
MTSVNGIGVKDKNSSTAGFAAVGTGELNNLSF